MLQRVEPLFHFTHHLFCSRRYDWSHGTYAGDGVRAGNQKLPVPGRIAFTLGIRANTAAPRRKGAGAPQFSKEGGSAIESPPIGPIPRAAGMEGRSAEQILHTWARRASPFRNGTLTRDAATLDTAVPPRPRLPAHAFLPSPPPRPTAARPLCARPPPKPRRLLQPAIKVKPAHLARPLLPAGRTPSPQRLTPSPAFPSFPTSPRVPSPRPLASGRSVRRRADKVRLFS